MGSVFRVEDPRLSRKVALKILQKEHAEGKSSERFKAEARITGSLEHPSIPPVYEYGETEDRQPYFALKLLQGETLESLIKKLKAGDPESHERYPFPERVRIAVHLSEALDYAHSQQVIHRDIKPENVMLGPYGEVWLVDWGVAGPPSENGEDRELPSKERLTEEATFMGTLEYAAPEQLAGIYSPASDQYSLGAVMYEMFCLEAAHPGKNRFEVLTAVVEHKPKLAETLTHPIQGRVPREISTLISRMLQKKPEERFESFSEITRELKVIMGGDINAICPHTLTKKTLHRFGRALDNHNYWLMPLLMLWLLYPLYAIAAALSSYLFP